MKRPIAVLFAAALLASGTASAEQQYKNGQELVGSWKILATIPGGTPVCPGSGPCQFHAMATVIGDGTVVQSVIIPGVTFGHGAWKRTGLRTFRMNALYSRVDGSGIFVGTSETTIELQVDANGRTASGSFSADINDTSGNLLTDYEGTVTAQRIEVN
jgi:hypothetical protein